MRPCGVLGLVVAGGILYCLVHLSSQGYLAVQEAVQGLVGGIDSYTNLPVGAHIDLVLEKVRWHRGSILNLGERMA